MDHLNGDLFIEKASVPLQRDLEMTKHGFMEGDVEELERRVQDEAPITLNLETNKEPVIG
jgi:hypothetical protein